MANRNSKVRRSIAIGVLIAVGIPVTAARIDWASRKIAGRHAQVTQQEVRMVKEGKLNARLDSTLKEITEFVKKWDIANQNKLKQISEQEPDISKRETARRAAQHADTLYAALWDSIRTYGERLVGLRARHDKYAATKGKVKAGIWIAVLAGPAILKKRKELWSPVKRAGRRCRLPQKTL